MATPIRKPQGFPFLERPLPQNLDAERSVLGAVLLDNSQLTRVRGDGLLPGDFFSDYNRRIFVAIAHLSESHSPIDALSVNDELARRGELEAAGGAAYVAQLLDGVPSVTNAAHYARIVREKSTLRQLIHTTHAIQQRALDADEPPEAILSAAAADLASIQKFGGENPAVVVDVLKIPSLELPPLEYMIEPLLTFAGVMEAYSWRGVGKSFVVTLVAYQLARGAKQLFRVDRNMGGCWPVARKVPVLYVYGEMHGAMIKTRFKQIMAGEGLRQLPDEGMLGVMCKDFQRAWRPSIATPRNRRIIEDRLFQGGYKLLVLDNISTLWPGSNEDETDQWATLTNWFVDLTQEGISVIFCEHAGKSGLDRGTSKKQDIVDSVLRLKRYDHWKDAGLRAEVKIEKLRGDCKDKRQLIPFEVALTTESDAAVWTMRPVVAAQMEAAFKMFASGMKAGEVAQDLGVPRSTAYWWKTKRYDVNPDPKFWGDDED